jgi:hypothetical protein
MFNLLIFISNLEGGTLASQVVVCGADADELIVPYLLRSFKT